MPKVAILCRDVAGVGGTTTTILQHCRRLCAAGWEPWVYGERLDQKALKDAGAVTRSVPSWPWGSYFKRRLFAAVTDGAVARGGFDLVHGHGDNLSQDVLSLHNCVHAAHEAVQGKPLKASSGVGRIHERQLRERRFRKLIANSKLIQDEVCARFGVPREMTQVIYPGYDAARFRVDDRQRFRGPERAALKVGEGEVLFGLITSGDFQKRGVDVFLRALGELARAGVTGWKAVIIGKESRLAPYVDLAVEEGVIKDVRFLPPAPDVERFYHALDVYVHPAHYEEFGQSVQEALACGLPVVSCRKVGAAELLSGEARDWLLERPEPGPLAKMLKTLAADAALRRRLGALGPPAVAGNDWERNFVATLDCYTALLKR